MSPPVRSLAASFLAGLLVLASACSSGAPPVGPAQILRDDAVTIASFNFGESVLLAELYAQAIEARGIRVDRELDLGPRELVLPSLDKGLVELVPEYAGSLLDFLAGGGASASLTDTRSQLVAALERRGLTPLASSSAQDQNGFAVTHSFASERGIEAISDLASVEGLVLGGPPECPQRSLCEPGLEGAYGIDFASFVPLDQSGTLTTDALVRGVVDVALIFTTSSEIVRNRFVLLRDDRHLQPAENVTPVIREDTLERFGPGLVAAIDAVSNKLTTDELRDLNAQVEIRGRAPADVAHDWLSDNGLLNAGG